MGFPTPTPGPRRGGGRRLPDLPRPAPGDGANGSPASWPSASSPTTRPTSLVTGSPPVYLAHDTAIAPVLQALFTQPEFAARSGKGPHAVRGPRRDRARRSACGRRRPGPTAARGARLARWQGRAGALALARPERLPRRGRRLASAPGMLARWDCHLSQAARLVARPGPAHRRPAARCCRRRCPRPRGASSTRSAARLLIAPLPPAHGAAVCAFVDAAPANALRATTTASPGGCLRRGADARLPAHCHAVRSRR